MIPRCWLNDKLIPQSKAKISILDRGFLYGDGVYEAVRVYEGKIFRAEEHWERLDHSLKSVRIKTPWSNKFLTHACNATIKGNRLKNCLLRITISRGTGALGYDPSLCKNPTLTVIAWPVREDLPILWNKGTKIAITKIRRNHVLSLNPAIKNTNSLNGILAKMESLEKGAFEGVLLNLDDHVAEGTISNIFMVKNGIIKTPSLRCGILDGVTRAAMIQTAKKSKLKVVETKIKLPELIQADEVFLTSTTMEAMPVIRIDQVKIGSGVPGPVTIKLQRLFKNLVQKELHITYPSKA